MEKDTNLGDKPKKKNIIKYILSIMFMISLLVATIIVICTKYNIKELIRIIGTVNFTFIFISIGLIFIYVFFEGAAVRSILKAMGENTTFRANFAYSAIDYYFCAVTPSATGGQPMVAYYMAKDKIPITKTSIALLINTGLFKIVLMTLSLVALIIYPHYVGEKTLILILFIIGFAINLFLVTMCFLGAFKSKWIKGAGKRIIMLLNRIRIVKNPLKIMRIFNAKMEEYAEAGNLLKNNRGRFIQALVYNFIQRLALFSASYFVFLAFKTSNAYDFLEWRSYFAIISIQVIIALSVDSLPLPGGVGISEVLYVFLYALIYIDTDLVASAMLITRAVSFYIPLIVTAIIWLCKHIIVLIKSNKKRDNSDDMVL